MAKFTAITAQGDGQLPASKGTLYTVPSATQAAIRTISLVNTSDSEVKVNLYLQRDGTNSRHILPVDMKLRPKSQGGMVVIDDIRALEAGDLVQGDAAAASTVDFIIDGIEES